MSDSPRDFPGWMQKIERDVRNTSRSAMRAAQGARDAVGDMQGDLDAIRDDLANLPDSDVRVPTAPVEITAESSIYLDEHGVWLARVTIDFPDVIRATDGMPIAVTEYELQGYEQSAKPLMDHMPAYPGAMYPWAFYPGTPRYTKGLEPVWENLGTSNISGFNLFGVSVGQFWAFRIRAVGGEWSQPIRIETARDTTPPPQPTAPVVESKRGVLMVTYDGMAVTGPQPSDYVETILVSGTESSPGLDKEVYRFGPGGGVFTLPGVEYYETRFFRLISVDSSGNRSVWSEQASGYPSPMVDRDVILQELDAAKTHLKNVDAGVSILPDTIITEHLHVTESMTAAMAEFLHVRADMLETNDIWADNAWLGYAEAALVKADMFVGKEFIGGTFTGSNFRTADSGNRTELTQDGLRQVDGLGRDLLRIGYGIETGMSLRNPGSGILTPLSNMVFGGTLWSSERVVTNRVEQNANVNSGGTNDLQTASYTATSTSVMMLCSTAAWVRSQDPTDTAAFHIVPKARLKTVLVPRRTGVKYPTEKGPATAEMEVQVVPNYIPDPSGVINHTWTVWLDNLVPGEVYDMSVHVDLTKRGETIMGVSYNGAVVGVGPEIYMGWTAIHARPSAYILPR